jgi:pilus assembly protein Flp/PilA
MRRIFRAFWRDEDGATAIEYGLIAALVAVAAIVALSSLGSELMDIFTQIGSDLAAAQSG